MTVAAQSIRQVIAGHMCTGCGACSVVNRNYLQMVDTIAHGRRPQLAGGQEGEDAADQAVALCPAVEWPGTGGVPAGGLAELHDAWGPVLEIWEGHAVDQEIRFRGSSGGVATALALYCVERGRMAGALHVRAHRDAPLLNETVLSCNRASLLSGAGSRYSPASPCEGLHLVEDAGGPCVVVGKPCDVAATCKARRQRPALDARVGLTVAIFCAGEPSLAGVNELARQLGAAEPSDIESIRYRGHGWPGEMTATSRDPQTGETRTSSLSYERGWGTILQKHRPWRCHVCADHTGECSDVSVGDPWYRRGSEGDPGQSLVLVRTETGRRLVRQAVAEGYLHLESREPWVLEASQLHLMQTKAAMWGRLLACRLTGVAAPRYPGMPLLRLWWQRLGWRRKAQSLLGTVRRIYRRRLRDPELAIPVPAHLSRPSSHTA